MQVLTILNVLFLQGQGALVSILVLTPKTQNTQVIPRSLFIVPPTLTLPACSHKMNTHKP